jgi:hypothetical protein
MKIIREAAQFELAGDYFKTIIGHVLFKHTANQWWKTSYNDKKEGDSPIPNCYSTDGVKPCGGDSIQSTLCATCPMNKFGTGKDGTGKACRNTIRFLFLADQSVLPVILIAPPTSLSKKGSLQTWLNDVPNKVAAAYGKIGMKTATGGPIVEYWPARVELSLAKEKFLSGMEASVLKIKTLEVLTPTDTERSNQLRNLFEVVREARKAYEAEMTAYIESEAQPTETVDTSEPLDMDDDQAEIPV